MTTAIVSLTLACLAGIAVGRRLRPGYFDLLSPMCALYLIHGVARAIVIVTLPSWARPHWIVQTASFSDIASAVWLTTAGVVSFAVGYVVVWKKTRRQSAATSRIPIGGGTAVALVTIGIAIRGLLYLPRVGWDIPRWAFTPIETLGWSSLAGIFFLGLLSADTDVSIAVPGRKRAVLLGLAVLLTIVTAPNLGWSREAFLQPLVAALAGFMFGKQWSATKVLLAGVAIVVPILVFGHGVKAIAGEFGVDPDESRVAMFEESRQTYDSLTDMAMAAVVDRMHGLDSLIVCRYWIPDRRPFERGNVWLQVFTSAFVPRLIYPGKQVGWAARFSVEFWGTTSAGVGISHLGNFYVYGGLTGCVTGMLFFGAGLAFIVARLANRGDAVALCGVLLVGFCVLQIDRDLEAVLGGSLKLLVIGYVCLRLFARRSSDSSESLWVVPETAHSR